MIKHFFFFSILSVLLAACSQQSSSEQSVQNRAIEINENLDSDATLSISCNICLLEDSIQKLRYSIVLAEIQNENIDSNLHFLNEKLERVLDELKLDLKNNHKELYEVQLPENCSARTPENIALQNCKLEYYFDERLDSNGRIKAFFEFASYKYHNNLGLLIDDIDTSDFERKNGNYILKARGEEVRVPFDDFPKYWQRNLDALDSAWNYVNSEKNKRVLQITGKPIANLSRIEKLMFMDHALHIDYGSARKSEFIDADQNYQEYFDTWVKTCLNK